MNLSIALAPDSLPDDEQPAPEKPKPRWGNAWMPQKKAKPHRGSEFAYIYQHEKAFKPEWDGKKPGSTPSLPLKPPGGKP